MVQKSTKRRGRPPTYDPKQALGRALDVFWAGGFAATSLDDLAAATGMNRPSLYGAFGDKRALFLKALMAYRERGEGGLARLTADEGPLRTVLVNVYAAALGLYGAGEGAAKGCFLTGAALAGAVQDTEVGRAVLEGLEELDGSFVDLFRRRQKTGEVDRDADPEALGLAASAILHTLSIRTRAGAAQPDLVRIAAKGVDTLMRAAGPSRPASGRS